MTETVTVAWRDFLQRFADYVETFLAQRSMLTSALFPEKPVQMWFGYRYSGAVLLALTYWLAARTSPEAFGSSLRADPLAPANGLHLGAAVWSYLFAQLGRALETGRNTDAADLRRFCDFWARAHRTYYAREMPFDGRATLVPDSKVLSSSALQEISVAISDSVSGPSLQRLVAGLTSYGWLLEAESRQGVFSSGIYEIGEERLLLRCFNEPRGTDYSWAPQSSLLPPGQLLIAVQLRDVQAQFDFFGSARLQPEEYGEHVRGAAVLSREGAVADIAGWLPAAQREITSLHRKLYATIASWSFQQRLEAGATSYAKIWAALARAAGGSPADEYALVWKPLQDFLDAETTRVDPASPIPLWQWVGGERPGAIFEPLLAAPVRQS